MKRLLCICLVVLAPLAWADGWGSADDGNFVRRVQLANPDLYHQVFTDELQRLQRLLRSLGSGVDPHAKFVSALREALPDTYDRAKYNTAISHLIAAGMEPSNPAIVALVQQRDALSSDDVEPPDVGTLTATSPVTSAPFVIEYDGWDDNEGGSGLGHVELWYKKGTAGTWARVPDSALPSGALGAITIGQVGANGQYFFALVAEDKSNNRTPEPTGDGQLELQVNIP